MAKPQSQTTVKGDVGSHFATKLSGGARTIVAHGTTAEESQRRAKRVWEARDRQITEVAKQAIDEGLRVAFEELVLVWSAGTAHLSSPAKLIEHPAYRQIIGLGPSVLPLILADLEESGRFWFPALNAITGETPIPEDAEGDVERMIAAWLQWGRANGLV
jgi:hypothetical protein